MIAPTILFFGGFLKLYYSIPGIILILVAYYFASKEKNEDTEGDSFAIISPKFLIIIAVIVFFWCYLGGQGGLFYQSNDWPWRNATFYDLIFKSWPVKYESANAALVYYIGHWLPAAVIGKIYFFITGNLNWAWRIAKLALWLWTALGIYIVILLLSIKFKIKTKKPLIITLVIFILFSGLDIIGAIWNNSLQECLSVDVLHLEWWANGFQFSSITTCLFWVFNQAIIPWVATACYLNEKRMSNYMFIGISCLCCGPFPFIGLALNMIGVGLLKLIRSFKYKKIVLWIKEILSIQNVIFLVIVFPVFLIYYMSNSAIGETPTSNETNVTLIDTIVKNFSDPKYLMFILLEFGLYILIIWKDHKKDIKFYSAIFILLMVSQINVGVSNDFEMRASIPSIFILMTMCIQFVLVRVTHFRIQKIYDKVLLASLILALTIGAMTPVVEVYRGFYHVVTERTLMLQQHSIVSFDNGEVAINFMTSDYKNKLFFKYLAK